MVNNNKYGVSPSVQLNRAFHDIDLDIEKYMSSVYLYAPMSDQGDLSEQNDLGCMDNPDCTDCACNNKPQLTGRRMIRSGGQMSYTKNPISPRLLRLSDVLDDAESDANVSPCHHRRNDRVQRSLASGQMIRMI